MFPSVLVGIFFMLIALLGSANYTNVRASQEYRDAYLQTAQQDVADSLRSFFIENFYFPEDLQTLANAKGYEHLKMYLPKSDATTPGFLDQVHQTVYLTAPSTAISEAPDSTYRHALTFALKSAQYSSDTFLSPASNRCPLDPANPQTYANSLNWCSDTTQAYSTQTSNFALYGTLEANALARQALTVDKFNRRANALGVGTQYAYPAQATLAELRTLVKPIDSAPIGADAKSCSGVFTWKPAAPAPNVQGVVLGCEDLYNSFGNPVSYIKKTNSQIQLVSQSAFYAAGTETYKSLTSN